MQRQPRHQQMFHKFSDKLNGEHIFGDTTQHHCNTPLGIHPRQMTNSLLLNYWRKGLMYAYWIWFHLYPADTMHTRGRFDEHWISDKNRNIVLLLELQSPISKNHTHWTPLCKVQINFEVNFDLRLILVSQNCIKWIKPQVFWGSHIASQMHIELLVNSSICHLKCNCLYNRVPICLHHAFS